MVWLCSALNFAIGPYSIKNFLALVNCFFNFLPFLLAYSKGYLEFSSIVNVEKIEPEKITRFPFFIVQILDVFGSLVCCGNSLMNNLDCKHAALL